MPEESGPSPAPYGYGGRQGQKIGGYALLEPIGLGGMGEVWLAQHGLLGRLAAIKLIRVASSSASATNQARKRFEREARATSALRSPHTIAIYDFGVTSDETFYYAMELLEGVGLDVLVEKFGPVSPARAIHLLRGACESLAEAHQRGLIHRDIKPSNVFTCTMGLTYDFVKVLDFGLVKQIVSTGALTSLTATGAIAGSPAFMPPEAAKDEFTAKSDIYALGCVAYWLLTGRFVFSGVTALEMMLAHAHASPEAPSIYLEAPVPEDLEALVMECLSKSPETRPDIRTVIARLADGALRLPWTSSDAEAWWTANRKDLARQNVAMTAAHGQQLHGEALARKRAHPWTERERSARVEAGLARLQRHFLQSHLDIPKLETRIALVKRATDEDALERVFFDLPPLSEATTHTEHLDPFLPPRWALAFHRGHPLGRPTEKVACVMANLARRYPIEPGTVVKASSVMGYCVIELTTGSMMPGEMLVQCVAVMGGREIRIPSNVRVEIVGGGLLGSFEQEGTFASNPNDGRTLVRVHGGAVMGLVVIKAIDDARP